MCGSSEYTRERGRWKCMVGDVLEDMAQRESQMNSSFVEISDGNEMSLHTYEYRNERPSICIMESSVR